MQSPDPAAVRAILLDPAGPGHVWGEAVVRHTDGDRRSMLIILGHEPLGYYLRYTGPDREDWLSLNDPSRLREAVEPDDWQAAAGLFIPPVVASDAVVEFMRSGQRCQGVRWVAARDMPPDSIW